jgi:6-phosphogluconolactonase
MSKNNPEMHHELRTFDDAQLVAKSAAEFIAERARNATARSGGFTIAVSGGTTPWAMFGELATLDIPWSDVVIYQVDERCAPEDDPDRNLTHLHECLASVHPTIEAMPVDDADLEGAARRYGAALPPRFDLVHLGLGPDGHTASLVPGDPVLGVTDQPVAITTNLYNGRQRMTLTYPGLARADEILWLVTGADKKKALAQLLRGDDSIPAGRVRAPRSIIMADLAAT